MMKFTELTLQDFGVYGGRQSIDLSPVSPERPVILVGGLNGRGKTTIIDAIQIALYGNRAKLSNRGNLSWDEYLRRAIHRGASERDDGPVGPGISGKDGPVIGQRPASGGLMRISVARSSSSIGRPMA